MRNGFRRHGAGRHEMRTSTPPRLTPAAAEHLLDGGDRPAELHQLLAAAAGPGTARELAGEPAAVAAFMTAPRTAPLPSDRRPSTLSTALSNILAAKAMAAVVLLAGATGGVALAANGTDTPNDTKATTSTTDDDADSADTNDTNDPADATKDGSAKPEKTVPDASLPGLCRAIAAGAVKDAEHPPPPFEGLVAGADIAKLCTEFAAPGKSADAPGQVAKKTEAAKPTAKTDTPDDDAKAPKKGADATTKSAESTDTEDEDSDEPDDRTSNKGRSDDTDAPDQRSGQAVDR